MEQNQLMQEMKVSQSFSNESDYHRYVLGIEVSLGASLIAAAGRDFPRFKAKACCAVLSPSSSYFVNLRNVLKLTGFF